MRFLDLCEFFVDCGDLFFERCNLFRVIRGASRGGAVLFGNSNRLELRILQLPFDPCPVLFLDHDNDKRAILALYHLHLVRDGNGDIAVHIAGKYREMPEPPQKSKIRRKLHEWCEFQDLLLALLYFRVKFRACTCQSLDFFFDAGKCLFDLYTDLRQAQFLFRVDILATDCKDILDCPDLDKLG